MVAALAEPDKTLASEISESISTFHALAPVVLMVGFWFENYIYTLERDKTPNDEVFLFSPLLLERLPQVQTLLCACPSGDNRLLQNPVILQPLSQI